MATNQPAPQPSANDVLASLGAAADAARQAYMVALAANPGANLSALYSAEMKALAIWSAAQNNALTINPALTTAQVNLDEATQAIRSQLATLKDITTWLGLITNLVQLAATVGKFFA